MILRGRYIFCKNDSLNRTRQIEVSGMPRHIPRSEESTESRPRHKGILPLIALLHLRNVSDEKNKKKVALIVENEISIKISRDLNRRFTEL